MKTQLHFSSNIAYCKTRKLGTSYPSDLTFQSFNRKKDDRLLLLQKHYTTKIAETKDEELIRHYLSLTGKIAQQRLALRKVAQQ